MGCGVMLRQGGGGYGILQASQMIIKQGKHYLGSPRKNAIVAGQETPAGKIWRWTFGEWAKTGKPGEVL